MKTASIYALIQQNITTHILSWTRE